jgi:hypothetical protein
MAEAFRTITSKYQLSTDLQTAENKSLACNKRCHPLQPGFQAVAYSMFLIKQLNLQSQLLQDLPGTPENSLGTPSKPNLPAQIV